MLPLLACAYAGAMKRKRRRRKKSKGLVIQLHHIQYEPPITVRVTRQEHYFITRLSWFKSLSSGSKKAIRHILRTKKTLRLPKAEG